MLKWTKQKIQRSRRRKLQGESQCLIPTRNSSQQETELHWEADTMSEKSPLLVGQGGYGATPGQPADGYENQNLYPALSVQPSTPGGVPTPSTSSYQGDGADPASSSSEVCSSADPEFQNSGFRAGIKHPLLSTKKTKKKNAKAKKQPFSNAPRVTAEDAQEALVNHVNGECCYGNTAAKEMTITNLRSTSTFHYILETFTETRSTSWVSEPYKGQPINGPNNGPAVDPMQMKVSFPTLFSAGKVNVEVPHTAVLKSCQKCYGRGHEQCDHCRGIGGKRCGHCQGTGRENYDHFGEQRRRDCFFCQASGISKCHFCNGSGRARCDECKGQGSLKAFNRLTVVWRSHKNEHVMDQTDLPQHLLRQVVGQVTFTEQNHKVSPITDFPDQEVSQVSRSLISQHAHAFPSEKILMQRQQVRMIPVTQVFYTWKEQRGSFFVYGFDHHVYAPDYPQKCCCTIL